MTFSVRNHYVPVWYQSRFLQPLGESRFHYLDLKPSKVHHHDGKYHYRRSRRRLGPKNCFRNDHLYTIHFGKFASDIIEKNFFGVLDRKGATAVELYSDYVLNNETQRAFNDFLGYMDAQKMRTPKGLDYLKSLIGKSDHQQALALLGRIWQVHCTMWQEAVWEILCCDNSPTKFIITDNPVCTYNKGFFPGAKECTYPNDAPIECVGTHTLFPLGLNRCLVITNLGYVRNPKINPCRIRENPRSFVQTMFDLRKIQTGRQISEEYVQAINYVLKNRAKRYLAAAKEDWLYPERYLKNTFWSKLGGRYFLMPDPRKVTFVTARVASFNDGTRWGEDEYGRSIDEENASLQRKRDKEWDAFQASKGQWDAEFGPLDRDDWVKYV